MSGIEAAKKLYKTCRNMDIEETMELMLNAETEEEEEFFSLLSDFILQRKQKEVIEQMKEKIVLASVEDVKHVGNMYDAVNDYFEKHENYCYPNWQKGKYPVLEDAKKAMENQTLYVLKTEEGIAGAIIIDHTQHSEYKKISWTLQVPDESVMTMHTVVVAPDYRGRGFGEKLVRFGIDFCKNSGAKTIRLDTHHKNVPARQLYKKRGFVSLECHESFVESISL